MTKRESTTVNRASRIQHPASNSETTLRVVFVGHVDHGKSTLIGRILSDTNSLPEGKLDQVQRACAAENMEFEFAFLLDALLEAGKDYTLQYEEDVQAVPVPGPAAPLPAPAAQGTLVITNASDRTLSVEISGPSRASASIGSGTSKRFSLPVGTYSVLLKAPGVAASRASCQLEVNQENQLRFTIRQQ